jgi:hypothetical protein
LQTLLPLYEESPLTHSLPHLPPSWKRPRLRCEEEEAAVVLLLGLAAPPRQAGRAEEAAAPIVG